MDIYWLNDDSRTFLSRGYLAEGQTAEERMEVIAQRSEEILKRPGHAAKVRECLHKGWWSLSSPVWSNFGNSRGLPISCNNVFIADDIASILEKTAEIGMQTKLGAGTSAYVGKLRPRGSKISVGGFSYGPVHFMEMIQTTTNIVSQSNVRRGSCAVYLDVDHPDILEFLEQREEGKPIQHLSMGVCVSDEFMNKVKNKDKKATEIWLRIIRKRFETGYPYIFFTDTVNRKAPDVYRDKDRKIHSSNLCSEIALSSTEDESFVCNLASMNLLHFDEWKDTHAVETMVYFLDSVMTEYIQKISAMKPKEFRLMQSAFNFATRQRALGIGTLGWHSYLQSKMEPFEGLQARLLNMLTHKTISNQALAASKKMVTEGYDEPELLKGYGRRHVTLMAIAPTTSSSFILGQVSPSIEPLDSNYFVKDLQKGKFTYKNPYLKKLLAEKGKDTIAVWESILMKGGSVQHLDFLSEWEKGVFKTFGEINQFEIVDQAKFRQVFIDQTQSLNLKIHPDTPLKEVNALLFRGWEQGVKTFYYQRSTNPSQEYVRGLMSETCSACEA